MSNVAVALAVYLAWGIFLWRVVYPWSIKKSDEMIERSMRKKWAKLRPDEEFPGMDVLNQDVEYQLLDYRLRIKRFLFGWWWRLRRPR